MRVREFRVQVLGWYSGPVDAVLQQILGFRG